MSKWDEVAQPDKDNGDMVERAPEVFNHQQSWKSRHVTLTMSVRIKNKHQILNKIKIIIKNQIS